MTDSVCKICGGPARVVRDEPFHLDYFLCPACEFVSVEEAGRVSEEEERLDYLKHDNTFANEGYVRMLDAFIDEAVAPFAAGARTALDFGCGPGPVLAGLLRQRGLAVDVHDKHFAPGRLEGRERYDLITATEVLEHLADPLPELERLAALLTGRGVLSVMTLFHPGDGERFRDWWYRREATHVSFYTERTLREIAGRIGLRLLWTDGRRLCVLGKGEGEEVRDG